MPHGGQRFFALIPTTAPVTGTTSHKPMTSKAAKQAYQKANRSGPRVTKAEQRRLDAEERERRRKQLEKEKAASKARAAREKKAEKESAARLERKRLGLPEPSKFVRPSQPTISRFVKGEGGKRKWLDVESIGDDSEGTLAGDEDIGEGPPPAKRLTMIMENHEDEIEDENEDAFQEAEVPEAPCIREGDKDTRLIQAVSIAVLQDPESEEEFGEFPSFSQPGVLEGIDSPVLTNGRGVIGCPSVVQKAYRQAELAPESNLYDLPAGLLIDGDELFDDSEHLFNMANAQLLSEEAEAVLKSDGVEPDASASIGEVGMVIDYPAPRVNQPQLEGSTNPEAKNEQILDLLPRTSTQPQFKLPPPPKSKSISFAPPPLLAPRRTFVAPSRQTGTMHPMSTMAFLEDNLDDFLPSPSQEIRELLDDIDVDELPSNTQIAREISPVKSREASPVQPAIAEINYDDLICTQDLILSSQDLREISPVKTTLVEKPAARSFARSNEVPIPGPVFKKRTAFDKGIFDDFPSTQELVLTPQDLEEIETPSRGGPLRTVNNLASEISRLLGEAPNPALGLPRKVRGPPPKSIELPQVKGYPKEQPKASKKPVAEKPRPKSRDKPRFFEEKEADLIQAAIQESKSKNMARHGTRMSQRLEGHRRRLPEAQDTHLPQSAPRQTEAAGQGMKTTSPPRPKRFFEEKETDLLQAAIHESKAMAVTQKGRGGKAVLRSGENHASMVTSTVAAAIAMSQRPSQGAQSDYGDDEFDGLSELDLLGLL